jgi:hypothetical protein
MDKIAATTNIAITVPNQTVCTKPNMVAMIVENAAARRQAVPSRTCRRNEVATGKNSCRLSFKALVAFRFTAIVDDT